MANVIELKIVVDNDCTEAHAEKMLEQVFSEQEWILDHEVSSCSPLIGEIEDAIVNETYEPGDAFAEIVLFSPKQGNQNGFGFWSTEFGWTTRDLATRFSCFEGVPKTYDADDVEIVPANGPTGRFFIGYHPADLEEVGVAHFQCWANTREEAMEQALRQFPGTKPIHVDRIL